MSSDHMDGDPGFGVPGLEGERIQFDPPDADERAVELYQTDPIVHQLVKVVANRRGVPVQQVLHGDEPVEVEPKYLGVASFSDVAEQVRDLKAVKAVQRRNARHFKQL